MREWGKTEEEENPLSANLPETDRDKKPVTSRALHTWTFLDACVFLSLSSEIAAGILSKDTNNHQLITTVRFCHRGVKVCCRYGPGGRVILWLLEVTPCLHPDVSCFFCALFFLFFFWKGLLVDKQGNLKHEVYVPWSGLKGRWMSCFLFGFQSRQSIFLACGEWRAANSERSCCWRCICSGSLRCPCRGTPVQITTMVSLQKCAWVTVTFIYFIFFILKPYCNVKVSIKLNLFSARH